MGKKEGVTPQFYFVALSVCSGPRAMRTVQCDLVIGGARDACIIKRI